MHLRHTKEDIHHGRKATQTGRSRKRKWLTGSANFTGSFELPAFLNHISHPSYTPTIRTVNEKNRQLEVREVARAGCEPDAISGLASESPMH